MVKRKSGYTTEKKENMRGGEGVIVIEHLLSADEMYDKGRLYAKMIIEPGCSVGQHIHEGEMESYYILSGDAEVTDNDEILRLSAGDSLLTRSGEGHSVKNVGDGILEVIALILYK